MIKRFFIGTEEKLSQKTYFWTIISGLAYSSSTYIMFLVCSLFLGAYWAGIFSIAMSISQQLVTVGYFNTRTYQVSDIKEQFTFSDYFMSKVLTSFLMLVMFVIWILHSGYSSDKVIAAFVLTLFRVGEVFADVCQGLYQQKGRYDITGRCVFVETVIFLAAFSISVIVTRDLLFSLGILAISYIFSFVFIERKLLGHFSTLKLKFNFAKQKELIMECFPLFLNSFLLVYINNASKYAVDKYISSEQLARFNTIFMVAFVINLLAGFLLKPIVTVMAVNYGNGEWNSFFQRILKQLFYIAGITVVCIGGAYVLGIPVLSLVSGYDLEGYRTILCLVLIGGSLNAVYQIFQSAIIIMRKQSACFWGTVVAAGITMIFVPMLTRHFGVMGATVGYVSSMLLLSMIYALMVWFYYRKENRK